MSKTQLTYKYKIGPVKQAPKRLLTLLPLSFIHTRREAPQISCIVTLKGSYIKNLSSKSGNFGILNRIPSIPRVLAILIL